MPRAKKVQAAPDPGEVLSAKSAKLAAKIAAKGPSSVFQRGVRLVEVQLLLASGVTRPEVFRWLTTKVTAEMVKAATDAGRSLTIKDWAVSPATARDYIETAYREWEDDNSSSMARVRTLDRQRILHVYRTALKDGQLAVALRAAESVARMNGSYLPHVEAPASMDMEIEDAVTAIEHGYATLALAKQRGAITLEQVATAIDVTDDGFDGDERPRIKPHDALVDAPVKPPEPAPSSN
jgi:hypothetical protein